MAEDTTKLIISVEAVLKNLDRTLRGLAQVEAQLKRIATIKVGGTTTTTQLDRAVVAARRLEVQQQRLATQSQNLANKQERADQTTQRLALGQQRLAAAQERLTQSGRGQADAHVRAFQAIERGTKAANQATIQLGNSLRSIGQGAASLGATLSVVLTAPIVALGAASTDAAVRMDSLTRGLKAIVGSGAEASRQLARLTELAKLPGIGFEEAIQGSIRLQAVGFSAKDAERNLKEFANAVALTGGGREELARITVQLGQLAAKGKVLSQDLRPIIEAAPAVGRALKEAFGTVNADDLAQLTTSSQEFLGILVSQLEKLPRAAAGAKNSFENFRDTLFRAAATVGEAFLPALTKLIDFAGPIISALAKGFGSLSAPLRNTLVIVAALVAAVGPLLFILGQMGTGIGRIIVGLAQLNALGLLPTIRNMRLFAAGTLTAAEAEGTLAAASVATGAAIAGLAAILATIVIAYVAWKSAQSDAVEVTQEQLDASKEQVDTLKQQLGVLSGLKDGVARTAEEQDNLRQIYNSLNIEAQARVAGITDETKRTEALRAEVEKILQLRLQEREQQIASIAGSLATTAALIEANEKQIDSITDRIAANNKLVESLQASGQVSEEGTRQIARGVVVTKDAATAAEVLQRETLALTAEQNALRTSTEESRKSAQDLAEKLRALGITSTQQIRQFLLLSQIMGSFKGNVDVTVPILEQMIQTMDRTSEAARKLKDEVSGISQELRTAASVAEELQKGRQDLIRQNALVARESTLNFQNALKLMREFIAEQPRLRQAIQREAEIEGTSIEEVIAKALGGAAKDNGQALRNAQEKLSDALDRVQQAATEKTIAEEKSKNDQLLRINELRFSRELISFREFIVERARLQREEIQGEIDRQKKIATLAAGDVERAQQRAGATTGVEQVQARADEQAALARMTQAEAKILDLRSRQQDVTSQTIRELDQFSKDRLQSFRELQRELDEIIGKEGEAARGAIDERFAHDLAELRKEMELAGQVFLKAQAEGNKVVVQQAIATLDQLRGQVTTIENHKRELNALVDVREAQEEIRRSEEEQANLERRLAFEVQFRGLSEEEAIRQRLEGEAKVRDAIEQQQVKLEILAATMKAAGLGIPLALAEAIERLRVQSLGLAELPFVEQFRLAQKEFDRINDQRIAKIQEVERAVAHRDISELQGRIAIKAANGEYIGALEQQLALLQQIADRSGDAGLRQQAQGLATTTAEVRNATTEVADLNTEIRSISIDALRDSFGQFLDSLRHGADAAKQALNNMLDSVLGRVNEAIANRLFDKFLGPLLGGINVGVTGVGSAGGIGGAVAGGAGVQAGATAAAAALTTGGATAGAALTTGGVASATAITTSAAAFAATIVAAGAAFAATIAAAAGINAAAGAVGGLGGLAGGIGAATGMFPAVAGGAIKIVEGGFDEAVLTTDPKHAMRQVSILREYLARTRGLWGRVPEFAAGGMVSASQVESNLLHSLGRGFRAPSPAADLQLAGTGASVNLRNINLIDRGEMVGGHLRSATGERDILNLISGNRDEIGRRLGIRS